VELAARVSDLETGLEIKSRILTIYTTLLLMGMAAGNLDVAAFEDCILLCCQGITKPTGARSNDFITQSTTIFNRFFLMHTRRSQPSFPARSTLESSLDTGSTEWPTSPPRKRPESTLLRSSMQSTPSLPTIYTSLTRAIDQVMCDVVFEIEVQKPEKPSSLSVQQRRLGNFSVRKEEIRKNQLLEDRSLHKYFKETMNKLVEQLKQASLDFPPSDSAFQQKVAFLLNSP
jgi:hypothetical protein